MRILVTGATGFIGAAVVRALRRHDHAVLAVVRDAGRAKALLGDDVETAIGDMWRPETYQPLVGQVDAVIHAAQRKPEGRWSRRKIAAMHESDAMMTRALAQACLEQNKRFVYSSGALTHAKYGDAWIDETMPATPCLMGRGHAELEAELKELHAARRLNVVILSPGFVYGAGGFLQMSAEMLAKGKYRIIGDGANFWSLVHVDDVAEAYALALARGKPGEAYFLADDEPLPRRTVLDMLADAIGRPRPGRIAGWIIGLLFGFAMVEAAKSGLRLRNDKAKRDLGWTPRFATFAEGLPAVVEALAAATPALRGAVKA
jgi:nucleoside-diphosphate-sugar epimerase